MKLVKLGEVAEINPKLSGRPALMDAVSFVGMADVNAEGAATSEGAPRPFGEVSSGYTLFEDSDLLLAKITPCFENGKIAQARIKHRVGAGSTEFHVIRPRAEFLDPRYVLHFLRRGEVRESGRRRMTGAGGQRRVPAEFLSNLQLPVFRMCQQRRIAEVLDRVDALRAKRREAVLLLDGMTQSIFLDIFGHPSAGDVRWPTAPLGKVARTTSGGTPSRAVRENYGGQVPWVKSGELHGGVVRRTAEHLTERGLADSSAKLMPAGTVLVAMYGATAGVIARLGIPAATNQAICSIEVGSNLDREFLRATLKLLTLELLSKRVGGAQPNLSQGAIRALRIPIPPLKLQQEFAARIRAAEMLVEQEEQHRGRLDYLFASLQQQAFAGQL